MPLLSNAKEYVPQDLQSQSPILLKATAGLRMLGESEANALLQESRLLLGKSGFKFEASTGVEIMDGLSEAMFAWVTINYLRSSLSSGWQSTTQIAMDIGLSKGSVARTQDIKEMTLLGNPHRLYLHSFLG
jgi:Golgi nucleoside diphosphatase